MIALEDPSAYMKGIVAMIGITEFFRILDITLNWGFLSTHPEYRVFLQLDVIFVIVGVPLGLLALTRPLRGILIGFAYSVTGISITAIDPDFPHFVSDPIAFAAMDFVIFMVFTIGSAVLGIMLLLSWRGVRSMRERTLKVRK